MKEDSKVILQCLADVEAKQFLMKVIFEVKHDGSYEFSTYPAIEIIERKDVENMSIGELLMMSVFYSAQQALMEAEKARLENLIYLKTLN